MIEILETFPDNVLAVRASGEVTKGDYDDILMPAARAAFEKNAKLRVYYETAPDFSGFTFGAMGDDMMLGLSYLTRWERVAVVSDVHWMRSAVDAMRIFMPCPAKSFPLRDSEAAREWITAPAASA